MKTIGHFQVVHRIAVGGMAEVFLCRAVGEGGFEKVVAVKRILEHLARNQKFIKMFMDEARISATLSHSNIAQIFEFGRTGSSYFIAMEYVGGLSFRSVLRHFRKRLRRPPPAAMTAHIVSQICAGLEYAHTRCDTYGRPLSIVHRDVSPSNVLVSFNGEVKLIDFGVARASHRLQETVGGDLKGKYAYMSPEQARGLAMDHRSDIFSTGTILMEALAGANPFRGENDLATLGNVQRAEVPLPTTTLEGDAIQLYEICSQALARRPEERFTSAGEMQEALEAYCQRHPFGARQMARWMKETFPAEELRVQELLRRAAEEDAPTVELGEDQRRTLERVPVPLTRGRRATPAPKVATPVGPPPGAIEVAAAASPRQDPSRSPTPLTPGGHPVAGKVAVPAGPVPTPAVPPHRANRSGPWGHLVGFLAFVAVVAGVVFLLLSRSPGEAGSPGEPVGSLELRVDPPFGAQVFVDGDLHGAMGAGEGYEVKGLLAGKHRILLRGPRFAELERIVEIREGQKTPLLLKLKPRK